MTNLADRGTRGSEVVYEDISIESEYLSEPEEYPLPKEIQRDIIKSLNREQEKTRSKIAIILIAIYGTTLLACFSVLAVSVFDEKADKALAKDLAIILLNPATGMAAGAVGFYLGTRQKK
ncbi:hypothetical protein Pse7367_1870 [Thalassoporum mexicanum PCC 7367]|uniref:hypothetical protein n=1 Tax=Thalassoporum mexicanum TaxID=3457544 RepID=UPI00029FF04F|nr:hypothetical protein [Pseudanabaena sp. PCC 7367]AFY70146.1 hypothetical protein Pse7367_1870 [Pseudanabaena sp. PCC 7367]